MQKLLKNALYMFLFIFAITALTTLGGVIYFWLQFTAENGVKELPYLDFLIFTVIFEVACVVTLFVRKGLKYLPEVEINKKEKETLEFIKKFIDSGSSVTVVSNRLAWLRKPELNAITEMAKKGTSFEIITPCEVDSEIKDSLQKAGVKFYVTKETPPEARFTLVNGQRSGAERLAIARGGHPDHEITIFDNNSGPQIIAMAKDIIRKSKALADAA